MNFKLNVLALAALCSASFMSCDDDDDTISNIPSSVEKAFMDKYPNAQIEEYEQKEGFYVIDFHQNSFESEAWFGTDGWIMTETDVPFKSLPAVVQESFQNSKYADWKVDDVDKVERLNTETVFVIEVEKGKTEMNLYFSESGMLIKEQLDEGDNDNPYLPDQISSEIRNFIKKQYPNALVFETEVENGFIEVDIIDQHIGKEVVFNSSSVWQYTSWDFNPNLLPDVVKTYIQQNYAGYEIDDVDFYETPKGNFYEVELEKGDQEIKLRINDKAEIVK